MIENTKCECGHQNAVGTVLCESCGKPLFDEHEDTPLEMRYDGVARRSQRANPSLINRIWNFFSSVKIAVYIIIVTLLASILGTLYPQISTFYNPELVDLQQYYKDQYGWMGAVYHWLGLSSTYESWWYRTLLIMIGTSLVICSLDRVLPLYRALSKQKIRKHLRFITRQKVVYQAPLQLQDNTSEEKWIQQFAGQLKKKHYKVHQEGTALLAEKNRFSRWGPYINHIGLIVFLLAALLRTLIPSWSMDVNVELREGEMKPIPGLPYYLKNEKFTVEFHDTTELSDPSKSIASKFETKAVLYECTDACDTDEPVLEEVKRHNILVNYPLKYKELAVYQFHFEQTRQLIQMNVTFVNQQSDEEIGSIELNMLDPASTYSLGEYELHITDYYPELVMRDGLPATNSRDPVNPAFLFNIKGPDLEEDGESYFFVPMLGIMQYVSSEGLSLTGENSGSFDIRLASADDVTIANFVSYLNIRTEQGMSWIWVGAAISMIGLVMGFYWQHRRFWLRIDDGVVSIGGHTNKNWFGLRKELATILEGTGIKVNPKTLDNEVNGT